MTSFEIREIRALSRGHANRDAAQRLLERIAAQVLPVMTKRRFVVRKLQEFFPKDRHLLGMNVNRGQVIYLRLRPHSRPTTFLPYEALLETMLHELTHMYLEELKSELETMMVRGLVGAEGAKFANAGSGHSIATEYQTIVVRYADDNRAAVLAAQRREQYQKLLGGITSQRLGGANDRVLSPRQLRLRVLDAAERRRRDNEACVTTEKLIECIDLLGLDSDEDEKDAGAASAVSVDRQVIDLVDDSGSESDSDSEGRQQVKRQRTRSTTEEVIDLT
ncbi:hypothetical protein PINS_up007980 [Pythium insidiosum]|nr:hypothetical protein PINS_up007980 [Pythium insidiosum]